MCRPQSIFLNEESVLKDYDSGLFITQIAERNNCSITPIRNILKENNINNRMSRCGRHIRTEKERNNISAKHIGRKYSDKINKSKGRLGHPAYSRQQEIVRKIMTGSNNPNWKGGITPKNRNERNKSNYKEWRKSIFKRDKYTCQLTGDKGVSLQVHHIEGFDNNIGLRYNMLNGITLSEQLHRKFHNLYGMGDNTQEQFEEFKRILVRQDENKRTVKENN